MKKLLYLGLLSVCVLLGSCVEKNVFNAFDKVERDMDVYSDSALLLLEQIPHPEKLRGKQRADYVLLLTQARDKNYLDSMQSDSLIKLAVDYYKNGGDNVKAGKALFYYGKVMDLQGNDTLAMQAYLNALAKLEKTEEYKLQGLAYEYIGILNADRKLESFWYILQFIDSCVSCRALFILPACFFNAWDLSLVSQFTEADSADSVFS